MFKKAEVFRQIAENLLIFFAGCGKIERENRREWRGWRYELVKGEKLADYPVYWGKSIFSFYNHTDKPPVLLD